MPGTLTMPPDGPPAGGRRRAPMTFRSLFSWLGRKREPQRAAVLVYSRTGCHLCAEVWELLRTQQSHFHYTLEMRDVDADPGLAARFGEMVPVVVVNGKVRFWGRVNGVLLMRLLRAEASRKTPPV